MKREFCNVNKVVAGVLQQSVPSVILFSIFSDMRKGASGIYELHKAGKAHQPTGGSVSHRIEQSQGLMYGKGTAVTLQSARSVYIKTLEEERPKYIQTVINCVSRTLPPTGKANIIQ